MLHCAIILREAEKFSETDELLVLVFFVERPPPLNSFSDHSLINTYAEVALPRPGCVGSGCV